MKASLNYLLTSIVILFVGCKNSVNYEQIATYHDHSVPELNIEVTDSTKVLVVMPHADDEIIAGGLIALFKEKGALIHLLTLCEHNEIRTNELNCSASKLGIEKVEIAGFINNSWDAIMQDSIAFWYAHKDSIKSVIGYKINSFKPHYIITYDTEIGGYGHPEHRISAELTEEIFNENRNNSDFTTKTIFQITLSDKLESYLVSKSQDMSYQKN